MKGKKRVSQSVFQTPANSKRFLITETRLTDLGRTGVWAAVPQGEEKQTAPRKPGLFLMRPSYCLKV